MPDNLFAPSAQRPRIPRARLEHLAEQVHALGPLALYYLFDELQNGADIRERLGAFADINPDFLAALGGDRIATPSFVVHERRAG